jgi:hypothetical protein
MDPDYCAQCICSARTLGERVGVLSDLEEQLVENKFRPKGRRHLKWFKLVDDDGPSWRSAADLLDGSTLGEVPTVEAVAVALKDVRDYLRRERMAGSEVRLQVHDGWTVHYGDSSFDQDHRGLWGAGSVGARDSLVVLRETAGGLVSEALEAWYEGNGEGHGYDDGGVWEAASLLPVAELLGVS